MINAFEGIAPSSYTVECDTAKGACAQNGTILKLFVGTS